MPTHAVTWIDHHEARIFHLHPDATDETTILAPQHHLHRPLGHGDVRGSAEDGRRFFKEVARALEGADALLIVGPSSAKLEFFRYLHEHDRHLETKVVGVESADHPTDGEIIARARSCFAVSDRMG
jgi:stalled ribosome rescue protein Dom34